MLTGQNVQFTKRTSELSKLLFKFILIVVKTKSPWASACSCCIKFLSRLSPRSIFTYLNLYALNSRRTVLSTLNTKHFGTVFVSHMIDEYLHNYYDYNHTYTHR